MRTELWKLQLRRIVGRLVAGVGVLWGAATLAFIGLQLTAGDAALQSVAGDGADPTATIVKQVRHDLGLNLPVWRQYTDYLWRLLHGNLGTSYQRRLPVAAVIRSELGPTAQLAGFAALLAVSIALVVSISTARRRSRWIRPLTSAIELGLIATPNFVLGITLLIIFCFKLNWFPVSGAGGFKALVIPTFALSLPIAAVLTQVMREQLEDVLEQPFITTARARGMRDASVRVRHALRHVSVQLVTMAGFLIASLLGGAVVIEELFVRPGLGQVMLQATQAKDEPLVLGIVLFAAAVYVTVNLIVDIIYTLIDPKVIAT